ncbi:MAG: AsnC family transcriptional regulator [Thaumarchaeota archaeon]|nr:AsnC family transcriptional regulator [Nitrososphaerota archaeon]
MWGQDKAYSTLMTELWGSPGQWNVKKSYAAIARKLGVDEETVRNRIKHLRESGFLLGWRLFPNPSILGRRSTFLFLELDDPGSKDDAISQLRRMDGVVTIVSLYGSGLLLTLFDHEDRRCSRQITGIWTRWEVLTGMALPTSDLRVTVTDWQIVRLLLKDAERSVREVAREVGVSTRTVTRRLNEMMGGSAIFITPMVDLRKASGVSYQLMVQSEEGRKPEVDRLVASKIDNLVFRASYSTNGSIFGFNGANVAEGSAILKWVRRQEGVTSARMNIAEEVVQAFEWLDEEVERRATTR